MDDFEFDEKTVGVFGDIPGFGKTPDKKVADDPFDFGNIKLNNPPRLDPAPQSASAPDPQTSVANDPFSFDTLNKVASEQAGVTVQQASEPFEVFEADDFDEKTVGVFGDIPGFGKAPDKNDADDPFDFGNIKLNNPPRLDPTPQSASAPDPQTSVANDPFSFDTLGKVASEQAGVTVQQASEPFEVFEADDFDEKTVGVFSGIPISQKTDTPNMSEQNSVEEETKNNEIAGVSSNVKNYSKRYLIIAIICAVLAVVTFDVFQVAIGFAILSITFFIFSIKKKKQNQKKEQ